MLVVEFELLCCCTSIIFVVHCIFMFVWLLLRLKVKFIYICVAIVDFDGVYNFVVECVCVVATDYVQIW